MPLSYVERLLHRHMRCFLLFAIQPTQIRPYENTNYLKYNMAFYFKLFPVVIGLLRQLSATRRDQRKRYQKMYAPLPNAPAVGAISRARQL